MHMDMKWKTILTYGVLPVLVLAILVGTAIHGQIRKNETNTTAVSSAVPSASITATPAMEPDPACEYIAPRMVRAWASDGLDATQRAQGALIGERPSPMPDMHASQYTGALLSSTATTATCTVDTGGRQPFTVGLRLEGGEWRTALLRVPGADRP